MCEINSQNCKNTFYDHTDDHWSYFQTNINYLDTKNKIKIKKKTKQKENKTKQKEINGCKI